jgi:peptidoglycan-associated lipoprotein
MKSWSAALSVLLLVVPLLALPCCAGKKAIKSSTPSTPIGELTPAPPPPAPETSPRPKEALALDDVHFNYDESTLRSDAEAILSRHAQIMLERPEVTIRIEGHCDERGTVEYNLALGARRAQAALDYLVAYGVSRDRISTISYGKEKPLDQEHNETAWAKNRRAAFVVLTGA